jgi:hypothetical protein
MRKKATLVAVLMAIMSTSLFALNDRGDVKENTNAIVRLPAKNRYIR